MLVRKFWDFSLLNDSYVPDPNLESLTIPRQSLTVREIIDRYAVTGQLVNALGVSYEVRDDISDDVAFDAYDYDISPDERFEAYDNLADYYSSYDRYNSGFSGRSKPKLSDDVELPVENGDAPVAD